MAPRRPRLLHTLVLHFALYPVDDFDSLARSWRELEAHAAPGFFRGWTFMGCLAEERFPGACVLRVTQDGCDVALALVGRARGRHWLNQTGDPGQDAPFIEHNGLVLRTGHEGSLTGALRRACHAGPLTLAGIDRETLAAAAAAGWVVVAQSRRAPFVDLTTLSGPYLDTLSANARAQIRRSRRLFGPDLSLSRASSSGEAQAWFEMLIDLHQAAWQRRGQPGAFADPAMRRFHAALIARAWPRGEADLLRIQARGRVIGLLYNFLQPGRVLAYQSGFSTDPTRPQEKPGLVCHALAIQHYADRGVGIYDMLAGADRYKLTLAPENETLHWATLHRPWSLSGMAARAGQQAARMRRRQASV